MLEVHQRPYLLHVPFFSNKPLVLIGSGRSISTFDPSCFDIRVTKEGFVGFYYHIKTCCLSSSVIRVRCLIMLNKICKLKQVHVFNSLSLHKKSSIFPGAHLHSISLIDLVQIYIAFVSLVKMFVIVHIHSPLCWRHSRLNIYMW